MHNQNLCQMQLKFLARWDGRCISQLECIFEYQCFVYEYYSLSLNINKKYKYKI